jgi:hypothetical protein
MNEYGYAEEVTEEDMFRILGDNDNLLRVADVAVDIVAAVQSGLFDILANVNASGKASNSKKTVIGNALNAITKGKGTDPNTLTDKDKKNIEKIINDAIRSLNMSATSVYDLANDGESYRGCLEVIDSNPNLNDEFQSLFGITAGDAITLVDNRALNEAILDVIVQNSKSVDSIFI